MHDDGKDPEYKPYQSAAKKKKTPVKKSQKFTVGGSTAMARTPPGGQIGGARLARTPTGSQQTAEEANRLKKARKKAKDRTRREDPNNE